MPTTQEILDYYDQRALDVPDEILDIADQIFNIGDDDDIPEAYYVWIGRQLMRMDRGSQL